MPTMIRHFFKSLFHPTEESEHDLPRDPNDVRTSFLVEEPSWLAGAHSIATFWPRERHYALGLPGDEADRVALYSDCRMVGQDLRNAMVRIAARELPLETVCELAARTVKISKLSRAENERERRDAQLALLYLLRHRKTKPEANVGNGQNANSRDNGRERVCEPHGHEGEYGPHGLCSVYYPHAHDDAAHTATSQ